MVVACAVGAHDPLELLAATSGNGDIARVHPAIAPVLVQRREGSLIVAPEGPGLTLGPERVGAEFDQCLPAGAQ